MAAHQKKARRLNAWLVFIDENGLLLLLVVRRTWGRRGCTPVLLHRGRHRHKVSAIAALCVSPDRREVRLRSWPSCSNSSASSTCPLALVWDRSQTHRGLAVATFLDVVESLQFSFPPYAPELNPVEYVWDYLKTKPLANLAYPDVEVLATVGRRHARSLQRKPDLLRSSIRHGPLPLHRMGLVR